MLAAISVEGRVAGAERGLRPNVAESLMANSTIGTDSAVIQHQVRPVIAPVAGKGVQDIGDDAVDALDLAGCVVVLLQCCGPKISDAPSASCRLVQKALVKRMLRSETSTLARLWAGPRRRIPRIRSCPPQSRPWRSSCLGQARPGSPASRCAPARSRSHGPAGPSGAR